MKTNFRTVEFEGQVGLNNIVINKENSTFTARLALKEYGAKKWKAKNISGKVSPQAYIEIDSRIEYMLGKGAKFENGNELFDKFFIGENKPNFEDVNGKQLSHKDKWNIYQPWSNPFKVVKFPDGGYMLSSSTRNENKGMNVPSRVTGAVERIYSKPEYKFNLPEYYRRYVELVEVKEEKAVKEPKNEKVFELPF